VKKLVFSTILAGLILAVTLAAGEIAARFLTSADENGNVYLGERRLLPYRFPVNSTRFRIGAYEEKRDKAYVVDHPLLGWTVGPNRSSENGLYHSNSRGIRSYPREYSSVPESGTLRIALFGDSFTHGDEEPWYNTWAYYLERYLNQAGIRAEVLNFGVGGYGFSQAYLRWLHQGREFQPRIVVIGFQGENIQRTVNLFRSLYSDRTWLVFSKPRQIILPEGRLETINSPVIPPSEVADYLLNFSNRPLARYEFWYNPENYRAPFWTRSRLGQIVYNCFRAGARDHRDYAEMAENGGTPEEVTGAVILSWGKEIRQAGAIPLVVHLPRRDHLRLIARDEIPAYYELLEEFQSAGIEVADPGYELADNRRGCFHRSHYSLKANRIVARVLSERIESLIEEIGEREIYRRPPPRITEEDIFNQVAADGSVDIDIGDISDELFLEDGFYDREIYQSQDTARWTSGTSRIRLPLTAAGSETLVEIHLVAWGPRPAHLQASLDGVPLDPAESETSCRRFVISDSGQESRMAVLTISVPTWIPAEVYSVRDHRRLGVMIDRIRVIPRPPPQTRSRDNRPRD